MPNTISASTKAILDKAELRTINYWLCKITGLPDGSFEGLSEEDFGMLIRQYLVTSHLTRQVAIMLTRKAMIEHGLSDNQVFWLSSTKLKGELSNIWIRFMKLINAGKITSLASKYYPRFFQTAAYRPYLTDEHVKELRNLYASDAAKDFTKYITLTQFVKAILHNEITPTKLRTIVSLLKSVLSATKIANLDSDTKISQLIASISEELMTADMQMGSLPEKSDEGFFDVPDEIVDKTMGNGTEYYGIDQGPFTQEDADKENPEEESAGDTPQAEANS
jgi:hypothetical protein